MSNLPHPLGDTNPGELFYPGSPQVTVADSPGADGSRAVEFGEDGYSAAVNRGLYALGKNDEYMEARHEAKVGRVLFTSWTPSGGNGDKYTFASVDLFVGAADYLPESQKIRDALISVLDSDYNELINTAGNKVTVKSIKNSGGAASIVGDTAGAGGDDDGFYNGGAEIEFQTVHPVTGAIVDASYTIPNGTNVILAHAVSGTLDTLATSGSEHLMRDAWVKGVIRNAHEIHAGTFLRDGSRKAMGDFDMDTHKVITEHLQGHGTGSDLEIGHSSGDKIRFRDQWSSGYWNETPYWNTGYTPSAFSTLNDSVIGAMNSLFETQQSWAGNRTINRVGSFTYTPGTGQISYPNLFVNLNGQYLWIPAGNVNATNTGTTKEYIVVTDLAFVVVKSAANVSDEDIVVEVHAWNGSAFATMDENDLRWPNFYKAQNALHMTCGDVNGADFTSLDDAINVGKELSRVGRAAFFGGEIQQLKIKVMGKATLATQVDLDPTQDLELTLVGDGWENSKVEITATNARISLAGGTSTGVRLHCENIQFTYNNASDSGLYLFLFIGPANGSKIKDCLFTRSGAGYYWGVMANGLVDNHQVQITGCRFIDWKKVFDSSVIARSDELLVADCNGISGGGHEQMVIEAVGKNITIMRNKFKGDWSGLCDIQRDTSDDEGCYVCFNYFESTIASPSGLYYGIYINTFTNPQVTIAHNRFKNVRLFANFGNIGGDRARIEILYNHVDYLNHNTTAWGVLFNDVWVNDQARIKIQGNHFTNTITTIPVKIFGIYGTSVQHAWFDILDNITDNGQAVYVDCDGVVLRCNGNTFRAPDLTSSQVIEATTSGYNLERGSQFLNNQIYRRAQSTDGIKAKGPKVDVSHNTILNTDVSPSFNEGAYGVGIGVNAVMDILSTPPGPVVGYRYLIGASPTGAWAGHAGEIVEVDTFGVWQFITPVDQSMVWIEDDERWMVHNGIAVDYSNWVNAESRAISIENSGEDHHGSQVLANKIVEGVHGIWFNNTVTDSSICDNYMEDLQGGGVMGWWQNFRINVSNNHFINVHGHGVQNASNIACQVIRLSTSDHGMCIVTGNHFERCGHRWDEEHEAFHVDISGGSCHFADNFFCQIQGNDDDTTNLVYIQGRCSIHNNRFMHEYGKAGAINHTPYNLRCIYINGGPTSVIGNHISMFGTPAFAYWLSAIRSNSGSHGIVALNQIDGSGFVASALSSATAINCAQAGIMAIGNMCGTSNVNEVLNMWFGNVSGDKGMAIGNRSHGTGGMSISNCYPNNGVAAPVNLNSELNW